MNTRDLVKMLQKVDPEGLAEVCISVDVPNYGDDQTLVFNVGCLTVEYGYDGTPARLLILGVWE